MTHHEIVKKLIGDIRPIGSSHIDAIRLENLKELCHLVEMLTTDIYDLAYENKNSHEHSCKVSADYATDFINNLMKP